MYFILIALILLVAYLCLLSLESRRSARYLAGYRGRLDALVANASFVASHVDLASFVREESIVLARRAASGAARLALESVRTLERLLARLVRRLHLHTEVARPAGESARHFVRTLSEFKGHLESTRPEMPEIR